MTNGEKIMTAQKRRQIGEQIQVPLPEYEGDIDFTLLSPFDVVEDITREDIKQDWKIVRSFKNKFDLIKVYPQLADELMKIETKSEQPNMSCMYLSLSDKITDDIPVWEFYHERTESVPEGRYILFCNNNNTLSSFISCSFISLFRPKLISYLIVLKSDVYNFCIISLKWTD